MLVVMFGYATLADILEAGKWLNMEERDTRYRYRTTRGQGRG